MDKSPKKLWILAPIVIMFSNRCIWFPFSSSSTLTPPKSHMTVRTVLEHSCCTWLVIKQSCRDENETCFIASFANILMCRRLDDMHSSCGCWTVILLHIHGARLVTLRVNIPCDSTPKPISFESLYFVQTTEISSDTWHLPGVWRLHDSQEAFSTRDAKLLSRHRMMAGSGGYDLHNV